MNDLKQETERLLAVADAATPGPMAQGRLPLTHRTSRWDRERQQRMQDEESRMVFIDFGAHDEGRSRKLIARCERKEDARIFASAPDMATHLRALQAENDRLQAECEALRVDVGRYRWLRNPSQDVGLVLDKRVGETDYGHLVLEYRAGEELDTAIDAAMNREREPCA